MSALIGRFLNLKNWKELNVLQMKALEKGILDRGTSFVIVAPTASGKTGVAEIAALQELENKGKVVYAVPSHALIDEKLGDFEYLTESFKVKEGKSTYSQWKKADLIVTTFELLYRACLMSKQFLDDFGLIVVDEFHILYDEYRGYNLEKVLTILKQYARETKLRVICISATIEDKNEISKWLDAQVVYFPAEFRPSQLLHGIIDLRSKSNKELCEAIVKKGNAPCLIFCSTKRFTRDRAIEMCNCITEVKNDENEITENVKKIISKEEIPELEKILCHCLTKGVGFHHSDLHKNLRKFVADLFKQRKIDYLFCTTGLAYGINFPAKTVVLADLTLWDFEEHKPKPIPIYLYHQMAGRAGRPQFDEKGFSYVVVRKDNDLVSFEKYVKAVLPRAISQIDRDEYFRKAILELIFSKRNTADEIRDFFEYSLFHFQATKAEKPLSRYNLDGLLKERIKYLQKAGFIELLGIKYTLTDFGRVTLEYLFSGYSSPELYAFICLNSFLEKTEMVKVDFDLIYFLSKTFPDCRISKQPLMKSKEVEKFLRSKSIPDSTNQEYSAYVVWKKWIENFGEAEIDNSCLVYSSTLPMKMWELFKIMDLYEKLAFSKNIQIPHEFSVLKERVRYGVREDELPFVKIPRVGREIARRLRRFCYDVLHTNFEYTGTPLDMLKAWLKKEGEQKFLQIIEKEVTYVGQKKGNLILSFVKEQIEKEKQN